MVEMTEAAAILHRATAQSLVLIDEIGRGTSTYDGLALAWAIAHQLAEKNRSLALFATHYFELTALPAEIEGCANVHFDAVEHADGIVFLHAVAEGPASRSYGLAGGEARRRARRDRAPRARAISRGSTSSTPPATPRPTSSPPLPALEPRPPQRSRKTPLRARCANGSRTSTPMRSRRATHWLFSTS